MIILGDFITWQDFQLNLTCGFESIKHLFVVFLKA